MNASLVAQGGESGVHDTPMPAAPVQGELVSARAALQAGNLQLAETLARMVLDQLPQHPQAHALLASLAREVGRPDVALGHLQEAVLHSQEPELRAALQAQQAALACAPPQAASSQRLRALLIKAWGYGFWSDLDHVAAQLLLAEITQRTPVVAWGGNSLFGGPGVANAFDSFFEPVSSLDVEHLRVCGLSYFPAKWHRDNLLAPELNKFEGPGSRITGLYALTRSEDVVVSDFHTKLNDLLPWIPASSEYWGLDRNAVYRRIFAKFIHLRAHLRARVEQVWQERLAGRNWLAVHVRGSDKVHEMAHLAEVNASTFAAVERILQVNPMLQIFLLTDSAPVVSVFEQRYGQRVLVLDCQRSSDQTGVHYGGHPGTLLGEQVLMDAYLAARCDFFVGNGGSNVSVGIRHLKDWRPGTFFLMGADFLGARNLMLHQR